MAPHPFGLGALTLTTQLFKFLVSVFAAFIRPLKNLRRYGATGPTNASGKPSPSSSWCWSGAAPTSWRTWRRRSRASLGRWRCGGRVVVDFTGDLVAGMGRIKEAVEGLDVGVLINNVGVSYPYARFFHEVDEGLLKSLVQVNVEGTTRVTQLVLPGMVERKRGAIVNIGSGAATVLPSDPLYAVYAATKAYIDQFSRCLYVEYKNKGIDVQCQVPLYVATKLASIRKSSFFSPSPSGYARAAIRYIGYEHRCAPYWPHSFLWLLVSMLPEYVLDWGRLRFANDIRKRGLAKDSRKKE